MKTLIVDDSRLARLELQTLLRAHSDIEVVAEAADVAPAVTALRTLAPDLVLLDVQLPGGSGFDVLEAVDRIPQVVFTTAYDHYAVRAFATGAVDYLVKPIDPARLAAALQRVRQRRAEVSLPAGRSPETSDTPRLRGSDQVFLRDGERCWFVAVQEITHIVVDGNHVQVGFRGQRAMLTRSLTALEARLDPALFFRANRNALVNLRAIRSIDPWINEGYRLVLLDGTELEVSRRQARELKERLSL